MIDVASGWEDAPSVLILADRADQRLAAEAAVRSAQARIVGVVALGDAKVRLAQQVSVDAVLIELQAPLEPAHDALLRWANEAAREGHTAPIICLPSMLIDAVMARIDEPGVQLLCDPSEGERAAQLGLQLARRRQRLHDHALEDDSDRLRRLSEDVARIAASLAEMSNARPNAYGPVSDYARPAEPSRMTSERVRDLIRIRRLREQFLPRGLFSDPAWDMLLDLYAARLDGKRVAVSSLCIAAAVPATTALRWIRTLTENGLFIRHEDPGDGRRVFIALAEPTADALSPYFATAFQMGYRLPST